MLFKSKHIVLFLKFQYAMLILPIITLRILYNISLKIKGLESRHVLNFAKSKEKSII